MSDVTEPRNKTSVSNAQAPGNWKQDSDASSTWSAAGISQSLYSIPLSFTEKQRLMGMLLILWGLIGLLDYLDLRILGRGYPISVLYVLVLFPSAIVFGMRGLVTATIGVMLMYHLTSGKISLQDYHEAEIMRLMFIFAIGVAFERIGHDRRKLKAVVTSLQRQTKAREDLAHMLVHDLRTPLTGIITSLQTLQYGVVGDLEPEQMEMVDIAVGDGHKLLEMVNQILDVSKLEAGEMPLHLQEVEMHEVADSAFRVAQPIAEDRGINLNQECNGLRANLDPELMRRVLVNLIGNALKFTPKGGDVTVFTQPADNGQAHLVVRDTGKGIPQRDLKRIFEKYAQSQGGEKVGPSTGLGLTFCRLAVEAHGGSIWAESELGKGTDIHITLPLDGHPRDTE
ncbi:MAG: HAMP domain-containing sensor histidine kinase [Armatimonadota bacterium]